MIILKYFLIVFFFHFSSSAGFFEDRINDVKEGFKNLEKDVSKISNNIKNQNYSVGENRVFLKILDLEKESVVGNLSGLVIDKTNDILRRKGNFEPVKEKEIEETIKRRKIDRDYYERSGVKGLVNLYRQALFHNDHGVIVISITHSKYKATGSLTHTDLKIQASLKLDIKFADREGRKKFNTIKKVTYKAKEHQLLNILDNKTSNTHSRHRVFAGLLIKAVNEIVSQIPKQPTR